MTDPTDKRALRAAIRAARAARPPHERAHAAEAIAAHVLGLPELAAAGCVTAYCSYGGEPGTAPLLAGLVGRGVRVLLPVVHDGEDLGWAEYDGPGSVAESPRGIPEPVGPELGRGAQTLQRSEVTVLLIPATAVDRAGARLGQGRGYYDRVLADLPRYGDGGPLRVALVHDEELLDVGAVPVEPHDGPVDAVVTDRRVLRVGNPAPAPPPAG
ncbi:MAG: 5-formyltetrahydrofolate cyclo-ligase [Candidatus Nanopelagicales bacterium]